MLSGTYLLDLNKSEKPVSTHIADYNLPFTAKQGVSCLAAIYTKGGPHPTGWQV